MSTWQGNTSYRLILTMEKWNRISTSTWVYFNLTRVYLYFFQNFSSQRFMKKYEIEPSHFKMERYQFLRSACAISSWQWWQGNLAIVVRACQYISFAHVRIRSAGLDLLATLHERSSSKMRVVVIANLNRTESTSI